MTTARSEFDLNHNPRQRGPMVLIDSISPYDLNLQPGPGEEQFHFVWPGAGQCGPNGLQSILAWEPRGPRRCCTSISAYTRPVDFPRQPTSPHQRTSAHLRLLRMAAGHPRRRLWRHSLCMRGWPRPTTPRATAAVSGQAHPSVSLCVPFSWDAATLGRRMLSGHRQPATATDDWQSANAVRASARARPPRRPLDGARRSPAC